MNQNNIKILIGAACGFTMGAAVAYFTTVKKLDAKYRAIANEEVASVKDVYARRSKSGEYATPESAAAAIITAGEDLDSNSLSSGYVTEEQLLSDKYTDRLQRLSYNKVGVDPEAREEANEAATVNETQSVFGGVSYPDGADEDGTDDVRSPDRPYIIREGEYNDDDAPYEKVGLTYYEGDHTLTDEQEKPIVEIEELVGVKNLERFGHLSEDDNIVYVRNERLDRDFEIIRDRREFSEVVYGLSGSVFDDAPRIRKMRDDD